MVSLQSSSLLFTHQNTPILSLNKRTNNHHYFNNSSAFIVHALEKKDDETYVNKFEIDPDEAKQALQQLDQQLKSFSKKQTTSPRIKAADVKITRGPMEQETLEISASFLTNTAVALLIFTIFYNLLFYAVIKPSIDGPDDIAAPAAATVATEPPDAAVNMESPPPLLQD